jgi:hypothetical protein
MHSSVAIILVSALASTILTTGLLTIICAITAAVQGYSLGELYVQYFPIFRGGGASTSLPRLAYVIFSIYVVAAELAIVIRRRLSH